MPIVTTEKSTKAEVMAARFHNLTEEVETLKLISENIVFIKAGIRNYAGLVRLGDSFGEQEALIKQRLVEIEDLMKGLDEEARDFKRFIEESPQGGVQ